MTLSTITISDNDFLSYASVAEAAAYLVADPNAAAWVALSDTLKGQYLVLATRRMDLISWKGTKTVASQATQWPRTGVTYGTTNSVTVDPATIPIELQNATIALAVSIHTDSANAGIAEPVQIRVVKAGSTMVEFSRPTPNSPLGDRTAFTMIKHLTLNDTSSLASGIAVNDQTYIPPFGLGGPYD